MPGIWKTNVATSSPIRLWRNSQTKKNACMSISNFYSPNMLRVLFTSTLLSVLSACGSIQENFSFQPKGVIQTRLSKSSFTNRTSKEPSDELLLVSVNHLQDIPNAPILLFSPPNSRPGDSVNQLLKRPAGPPFLKPSRPEKIIVAHFPTRSI